ncbi:iron ABC transporter permease [Leucobacter sp. OLJS4]|uniref:FecCD family ABC transporter permease n=1 Tax=unclassified Leucobacter TaxID=2621730 RepID=UPI000C18D585|nr:MULTISPECIES: iron ABC transporter permease [unclassified Leucobacter]PII88183.1 iron ABC transporter permease [Leucobacter sp. OLCALW19]PII94226.1 iron ABC transporter permease [Leucobacter sp. OLAS13]PII96382.1 iron ABC transporter permease [Leucobacter sp. OLTLW20]PII96574.1 iron ABC transporter permease [Leucobacter sp. OLCS4]PII98202.1 iron ABC transporter permease [Leucobacter sp. OLDS2]
MIPSVRESGEALGSRRSATGRTAALLLGAAVVLGAAAVLGLGLGSHRIDPATVVAAFVAYDPTDDAHLIVVQSRLPRIVLGIAVGAALGLAGALMQSVTRNPLADPGILGVNAGASLLVVLAIAYLGIGDVGGYIWFAFAGAAATAVVVYLLGTARGGAATPVRIALAGTAVAIVIGALTQMVLISNETVFNTYRYWAIGSLQGRGFEVILIVLPFISVGVLAALALAPALDALALGDEAASGLGARVAGTRIGAALAVVLLAGSATAAAGPIGFIGLGAAHIARRFTGNEHRRLLPASLVLGAALLVVSDTIGRAIVAPAELQTGIAAALFGAPFFIAIVRSRRVAAL